MFRIYLLAIIVLICSCGHSGKPDVSNIKVDLQLQRFEKDFFKIDTTNVAAGLNSLGKAYPSFLPIYLQYVLGLNNDSTVDRQVRFFMAQSRFLIDSTEKKYGSFDKEIKDFTTAFKYVKYYYPNYVVPKIITLIGPVDALAKMNDTYTPDFLGRDFLAISLQFYLGKKFSLYQTDRYIMEIAPLYRSKRFDEEYIVPDAMKLVVDDVYPDQSSNKPLIEQMIEQGKQWYLLDHFLPDAADSVKTGYTQQQLDWCKSNEGNIWAQITKTENIYSIEPSVLQTYLGEAPSTQGMPEASPGNLGQWVGWRIVQTFAEKNKDKTVQQVLAMPAKQLFEGAAYKPK